MARDPMTFSDIYQRMASVQADAAGDPARAEDARREEADRKRSVRSSHLREVRCTDELRARLIEDDLDCTDATRYVSEWHVNKRPWLVLSGPTGCGKTTAALSSIATFGGELVRGDELVRIFWANFGEGYARQQALRDARLLVIDDLGTELDNGRMLPALIDLVDARQSKRMHRTIVTTNLTAAAFQSTYSNAPMNSRMRQLADWVGLHGKDLRQS